MYSIYKDLIAYIKELYASKEYIPLHEPTFIGNENEYVKRCIDSTFVSSVGQYVDEVELKLAEYVGAKYAVAVVNGTSALHLALDISGVKLGEEVITQSFSFIATANAISYAGAIPVFIDIDIDTMGMSNNSLSVFLSENAEQRADGYTYNKRSNRKISACVPMHTFGQPCDVVAIKNTCKEWNICLIEDAAEALGSRIGSKHCGTFGEFGVYSFNGNKVITAGGGGMIVTDSEEKYRALKHKSTQAKIPHKWAFEHDQIAYNYRMPNLNAALLLGQMEQLEKLIDAKRDLALNYAAFFKEKSIHFVLEKEGVRSNYWLNSILLDSSEEKEKFLALAHENKVLCRPAWNLLSELPMYSENQTDDLSVSKQLFSRLVNIPSTPIL